MPLISSEDQDNEFRRQAALVVLPIVAQQGHDTAKTAVYTATIADALLKVLRKMERNGDNG